MLIRRLWIIFVGRIHRQFCIGNFGFTMEQGSMIIVVTQWRSISCYFFWCNVLAGHLIEGMNPSIFFSPRFFCSGCNVFYLLFVNSICSSWLANWTAAWWWRFLLSWIIILSLSTIWEDIYLDQLQNLLEWMHLHQWRGNIITYQSLLLFFFVRLCGHWLKMGWDYVRFRVKLVQLWVKNWKILTFEWLHPMSSCNNVLMTCLYTVHNLNTDKLSEHKYILNCICQIQSLMIAYLKNCSNHIP